MSASDLAGHRIREFRQRRGWTAKELADRCAEAGAPHITATVITNLETRRRRTRQITLDELLVLACVLKVPPILLFLPLNDGERLEITPAISTDPVPSALWLSGLIASPNMPDIADDDQSLRWGQLAAEGVVSIELLLDVWAWASTYLWISQALAKGDPPPLGVSRENAEHVVENAPFRLGKAIDMLIAKGITPPRLPRSLVDDLKARNALLNPGQVPVWDDNAEQPSWLTNPEAAIVVVDFARRLHVELRYQAFPADSRAGEEPDLHGESS